MNFRVQRPGWQHPSLAMQKKKNQLYFIFCVFVSKHLVVSSHSLLTSAQMEENLQFSSLSKANQIWSSSGKIFFWSI